MLKNFVPVQDVLIEDFRLEYMDKDGCGFSFPFVDGKVILGNPEAERSYKYCQEHESEFVVCGEIVDCSRYAKENAHGTCSCGNELYLWDQYYGACQCEKCGRWYNLFGQELVQPANWGKEFSDDEFEW